MIKMNHKAECSNECKADKYKMGKEKRRESVAKCATKKARQGKCIESIKKDRRSLWQDPEWCTQHVHMQGGTSNSFRSEYFRK